MRPNVLNPLFASLAALPGIGPKLDALFAESFPKDKKNRLKVASAIRETRPRVVILPYWKGRHPDHYTASILGYEACFLAGLAKLDTAGAGSPLHSRQDASATLPHRPFKIIYATLYYDIRPTFVVDISEQFEAKFASILAYKSQFAPQQKSPRSKVYLPLDELEGRMSDQARHYGRMIGVEYAEGFVMKEVMRIDDVIKIPVRSI